MTSTATDEVAAGAPTDPAGSPRNLTYTATYTAVTLSWDDPADDSITGYQILRRNRQDAGDHLGVLVDDTGRARQTYTDKDLEPRAEHEYQVKARNEHGLSLASNSVSVDVPADPDATRETAIDLGDITGFTSLHGTSGSVNNRSDQQDYYKFRVSESRIIYVKLGHLDVDAGLYLEDPQGKKLKIRDSSWTSERWFETPVERGTYFILVKAAEDGDNSYTLRYQVKNQTDDYARWTNTNGSVAFNGSSTGSIDFTGDRDWFATDLTAGQTYVFMHQGSPTDHGTLTDTAIPASSIPMDSPSAGLVMTTPALAPTPRWYSPRPKQEATTSRPVPTNGLTGTVRRSVPALRAPIRYSCPSTPRTIATIIPTSPTPPGPSKWGLPFRLK